jgi:hypothetical protein
MKRKIVIIAAVIIGFLFSSATILLILQSKAPRAASSARRPEPPFKFFYHNPGDGSATHAVSGDPRGVADFTSNIPVIVLQSESPGPVSGTKSYSVFRMEIYEPRTNGPACLANGPTFTTRVGVRVHGMVSRLFPKLSYRLKLHDDNGTSHKRPLLGMPADADWVLQGPWLDKSLIRNAFSYDLAKAMGCAAMRTRACEVFVNTSGKPVTEADYVGVYQLTEDIEHGKERVNLAKLAPGENSEPEITGGYLLAWDVGQGNYLPKWKSIQVKYPKHPSREQMAWIDRAFTQFDRALKGTNSHDPIKGYDAHIEVDDWVNYILFEEFVFNLDGYTRSFYLQKDRGAKIRPGPVWDHDLGLGHEFPPRTSFNQWWFTQVGTHGWVTRLMDDRAFLKKVAKRWRELREGVLRDDQIEARIHAFAAPLLSGAAERNFDRWKILNVKSPFTQTPYITIASATYPEQIVALKKFLRQRASWMDEHLTQ